MWKKSHSRKQSMKERGIVRKKRAVESLEEKKGLREFTGLINIDRVKQVGIWFIYKAGNFDLHLKEMAKKKST